MMRYIVVNFFAALSAAAAIGAAVVTDAAEPNAHPGRAVAQTYCQSCHLFPEPELLDVQTWQEALRRMAPYVGVATLNYETAPAGKLIEAAQVYPINPILSREEWVAINSYYLESAPAQALPQAQRDPIERELKQFRARKLATSEGVAMTCMVSIDPKARALTYSDGLKPSLRTVNSAGAQLTHLALPSGVTSLAPTTNGLLMTLIGNLFPTDIPNAQLALLLTNQTIQTVLTNLPRTTDVQTADLNGDGRLDFTLCVFGNRIGRFSWFEQKADGSYAEHVLYDRPGAIRSRVHDHDNDGKPDIFVLLGQAREGIMAYRNKGDGEFELFDIVQQQPLFGSADFQLADFNGDGRLDILGVNGDNGEYLSCFKNYHGVRVYLSSGPFEFKESFFYPLNGAMGAVARDFNKDGHMDIAAVSFFPNYAVSPEESFVYLEGRGGLKFEASTFPEVNHGRWIVVDAGDIDGDGDEDIALGSFPPGPLQAMVPPQVRQQWQAERVSVMLLENQLKSP